MKYNNGNVVCQVFNIVIQLANFAFARATTVNEKTCCSLIEKMRYRFFYLEWRRTLYPHYKTQSKRRHLS